METVHRIRSTASVVLYIDAVLNLCSQPLSRSSVMIMIAARLIAITASGTTTISDTSVVVSMLSFLLVSTVKRHGVTLATSH